jgi:hypothetical protein
MSVVAVCETRRVTMHGTELLCQPRAYIFAALQRMISFCLPSHMAPRLAKQVTTACLEAQEP